MKYKIGWLKYIPSLIVSLLPVVAGAQPIVWTTGSLQRTGPTDAAGSGTYVPLSAGRGEYESFQIVVQAAAAGLSNVNVSVSNLNGAGGAVIPSTAFTLYREQYVYVNQSSPNWNGANQPLGAGWYPDGLIPFTDPATGAPITGAALEAVPFSLSAAKNQPVWVDLLVPRNATPGAYTGTFTVTSDQGSVTGTLAVTVWHFTLPLQPSLKSSFLYWTADSTAAEEELLRNKLSPIRTPTNVQNALIGNYGLQSVALQFFSGADVGNCTMLAAPSTSDFAAASAQQAPGLYRYVYSADEIGQCPTLFPTLRQWALNMHKAGIPNLVTMAPNPALYDDGSGTGRSAVDIWTMLPITYDSDVSQMPVALGKGDSLWSYNTLVQDSYSPKWEIDFAPINYRIQPGFISQSLNLTGLLYWRIDDWSSDPWNQVNNAGTFSTNNYPGEAMLVYPGAQVGIAGVAPSMRLKWLRDGVEDYDYVQMLKSAGQSAFALGLAASVGPDWTHWTRDPNQLASVRLQLGQALDRLSMPPTAVTNVAPAAGTANASTTPTLSWTVSAGATSYSVFFGTSASPALAVATSGTSFAPGGLTPGTTYYWSVTAKNVNGSAPSATWSFTTQPLPPTAPVGLSPASVTGIAVAPTLTWAASAGATSYGVYFGTSASPALVATVAGTSFAPGALTNNTAYYWKVAATNAAGSVMSALSSFTTIVAPPAAPAGLSPASTTGITVAPTLTWTASAGATSYGVYFGTSASPSLVATVTGTSFSPGTLTNNTTYYWKVVAINAAGSVSSQICSFTTAPAAPLAAAVSLPPSVSSVTPLGGQGTVVTFQIVLSDAKGPSDLSGADVLINTSLNGIGACWVYYDRAGGSISLASDSTATWSTTSLGSASTIGNSQCTIAGTGVNAVASQSQTIVSVTVTFNSTTFAGLKTVYAMALSNEGLSSGYQAMGPWNVQ